MKNEQLEMIAYNLIEITMAEALTDREARFIVEDLERYGLEAVTNANGRIIRVEVVEAEESMHTIVETLGDIGVTEDIGLIRIITELEPQWEREVDAVY